MVKESDEDAIEKIKYIKNNIFINFAKPYFVIVMKMKNIQDKHSTPSQRKNVG